MRAWARFMYGTSAGIAVAWVLTVLVPGGSATSWYALGSGVALAIGLTLHQRSISLSRGRRWRKTP